jgi:hypothetical protein
MERRFGRALADPMGAVVCEKFFGTHGRIRQTSGSCPQRTLMMLIWNAQGERGGLMAIHPLSTIFIAGMLVSFASTQRVDVAPAGREADQGVFVGLMAARSEITPAEHSPLSVAVIQTARLQLDLRAIRYRAAFRWYRQVLREIH